MNDKKNEAEDYVAPVIGEEVNSGENQDFDYQTEEDNKPVEYAEPDWTHDNPIPVYIVETGTAEIPVVNDASYERFTITDVASEIAGSKRTRTRMIVKAEKANTDEIYIDRNQSVNTAFSFRLDAGESVLLENNDRLWARCAPTKTALLSVIQEYDVPLDTYKHV